MLRKREEKDTKIQPISTTLKVWDETKKEEWTVRVKNNFKVFNMDWILTSEVLINLEKGRRRKMTRRSDDKMLENLIIKHELSDECKFIYIDGSKMKRRIEIK